MDRPEIQIDPELITHLEARIKEGKRYNDDYVSPETYVSIFDKLGDLKGKKILDLGAGLVQIGAPHGTFYLPAVERKGATLIPVDFEFSNIITWKIQQMDEGQIAPLQADAFDLPFKDGTVDGAIVVNLLNLHWSSRGLNNHFQAGKLLREIARVTKKPGFVIISNFGYFGSVHENGKITYNNDIPEDQILPASEIRQLSEQNGFTVEPIPLDQSRMTNSFNNLNQQRAEDVERVEIVEPSALLLRK